MYFNEKNNTNIDNEFKNKKRKNKQNNFDFNKYKLPIFIGGGILIFIILLIVILSIIRNNKSSYYIELFGNDVMTIYLGDTFNDPGYNAYDNKHNDLTNEVIVDNQVDTSTVGEYQVTYTLYNTIKTRYVNVTDKPVGATSLFLKGDINMYLEVGEKYTEPGYVVIDSIDGSLKDKVKINNNVDTSKAGTYKVIYSVVNSSGVTTSAIRTVIVLGSEISLNLSNESYTNKDVAINIYIADNYFDYLILPNGDKVTKNEYSYKVSENGTYTFTSYNKLGKKKEESIKVSNINKTSPTGSCSGSYENGISTININASDDIGISKYVIENKSYTSNNITISKEIKTANVTIYDKAGNTKNISCSLKDESPYKKADSINPEYKAIKHNKNTSIHYYKTKSGKEVTYWLYLPDNIKDNLPIIMYVGGLGEHGNDYKNGTKSAIAGGPIDNHLNHGYNYDAIIVNPQVPANEKIYGYVDDFVNISKKIAEVYNANPDKISLIGFSHGCYGGLQMLAYNQNYFSAGVLIGCSCNWNASYFTKTPLWLFVGAGDGSHGTGSMSSFANQVNSRGGSAKYTKVGYGHHNVVSSEYSILRDNQYNVIDWMLKQNRKK